MIAETQEPHRVSTTEIGKYAVVFLLDPCARPTGETWLYDRKNQTKKELPSELQGQIIGGQVSALGQFIALFSTDALWILETSSFKHLPVLSGSPIEPFLEFKSGL